MSAQRTMSPEMRDFLLAYAKGHGRPGEARWAAEDLIKEAMLLPIYAKYLSSTSEAQSDDETGGSDSDPLLNTDIVKTPRSREVKTKAAATPKAPKAPKENGKAGSRPHAITINGVCHNITSWRGAFVTFIEHVLQAQQEIPANYFRPKSDRLTQTLSNGQHLHVNYTGEQFVEKMKPIVRILGVPVSIQITPAGEPTQDIVIQG